MDTYAAILLGLDSWSSDCDAEETAGLEGDDQAKVQTERPHVLCTLLLSLHPSDFIGFPIICFLISLSVCLLYQLLLMAIPANANSC